MTLQEQLASAPFLCGGHETTATERNVRYTLSRHLDRARGPVPLDGGSSECLRCGRRVYFEWSPGGPVQVGLQLLWNQAKDDWDEVEGPCPA